MNDFNVVDAKDATTAMTNVQIALAINGRVRRLDIDSRTVLLDALREHLHLASTKKGCDQG